MSPRERELQVALRDLLGHHDRFFRDGRDPEWAVERENEIRALLAATSSCCPRHCHCGAQCVRSLNHEGHCDCYGDNCDALATERQARERAEWERDEARKFNGDHAAAALSFMHDADEARELLSAATRSARERDALKARVAVLEEALRSLVARHVQHGVCISCGKGPRESTTPWGQCRSCARAEADGLRAALAGTGAGEVDACIRCGSCGGVAGVSKPTDEPQIAIRREGQVVTVRDAWWHCRYCGAHEHAEAPYTVGDKEPCITCGQGTAVVMTSAEAARFEAEMARGQRSPERSYTDEPQGGGA